MNIKDIEHMWKMATGNPNHDTNWYDPVIIGFAEAVAAHTLMNIDPSKFMSYREGYEAGRTAEREALMQLFTDPENQPTQHGTVTVEYMEREIAAEREACAKVCDKWAMFRLAFDLASAIRARGQA